MGVGAVRFSTCRPGCILTDSTLDFFEHATSSVQMGADRNIISARCRTLRFALSENYPSSASPCIFKIQVIIVIVASRTHDPDPDPDSKHYSILSGC